MIFFPLCIHIIYTQALKTISSSTVLYSNDMLFTGLIDMQIFTQMPVFLSFSFNAKVAFNHQVSDY